MSENNSALLSSQMRGEGQLPELAETLKIDKDMKLGRLLAEYRYDKLTEDEVKKTFSFDGFNTNDFIIAVQHNVVQNALYSMNIYVSEYNAVQGSSNLDAARKHVHEFRISNTKGTKITCVTEVRLKGCLYANNYIGTTGNLQPSYTEWGGWNGNAGMYVNDYIFNRTQINGSVRSIEVLFDINNWTGTVSAKDSELCIQIYGVDIDTDYNKVLV